MGAPYWDHGGPPPVLVPDDSPMNSLERLSKMFPRLTSIRNPFLLRIRV